MQTQPSSLHKRAVELLQATDKSYLTIYCETGLTPSWLTQLSTGRIKDPSVAKVQSLYEHLSGQSLEVG